MLLRLLAGLMALALAGCGSQQMLNRLAPDTGYQVINDLGYGAHGQRLDVYIPDGVRDAPMVVFFYGGRWSSGDKSEYKFVGQALASRGFVAVIANIRKYPQVRFPDFVTDGAQAVKWARQQAARYGGSADKVFVMGHSSGAHVAAMLALNEQYLKAEGGSRNWLAGMIGLAGPYDFLPITAPDLRDLFGPVDRFAYSQPIFFVDGNNPPLLLIHGENDEVVEVKNTRNLARAVAKAGGPVDTVIYPKLSHSLIVGTLASYLRGRADVLDNVESFVLKRAVPRPATPRTQIEATPLHEDGVRSAPMALPEPVAPTPIPEALPLHLQLPPPPEDGT